MSYTSMMFTWHLLHSDRPDSLTNWLNLSDSGGLDRLAHSRFTIQTYLWRDVPHPGKRSQATSNLALSATKTTSPACWQSSAFLYKWYLKRIVMWNFRLDGYSNLSEEWWKPVATTAASECPTLPPSHAKQSTPEDKYLVLLIFVICFQVFQCPSTSEYQNMNCIYKSWWDLAKQVLMCWIVFLLWRARNNFIFSITF